MIVKFQRAVFGGKTFLVYDKKDTILQELPMTDEVEALFKGGYKMYRKCWLDRKGKLHIGREVKANF